MGRGQKVRKQGQGQVERGEEEAGRNTRARRGWWRSEYMEGSGRRGEREKNLRSGAGETYESEKERDGPMRTEKTERRRRQRKEEGKSG